MRNRIIGPLALLLVALGPAAPSPAAAQARSDTVAIAEVLAQRFDSLQVRLVVPTACESPRTCDPPEDSSAWRTALRSAAPDPAAPSGVPPCPWNRGVDPGEAGYEMRLYIRDLGAGRAIVHSVRSCRQLPGELHPTYGLGEQFELERDGSEWVLRRVRGRWVT